MKKNAYPEISQTPIIVDDGFIKMYKPVQPFKARSFDFIAIADIVVADAGQGDWNRGSTNEPESKPVASAVDRFRHRDKVSRVVEAMRKHALRAS